jgi:hypothetical protein
MIEGNASRFSSRDEVHTMSLSPEKVVNPFWNQVLDSLSGAWRFRWAAIALAATVALAGWLVVFSLPDRYEADAKVLVNTRTALKPALQGLTTEQDVSVQLDYARQSLLADPELLGIGRSTGVLPDHGVTPAQQEALLDRLRNHIELTVTGNDNPGDAGAGAGAATYGIVYQDTNRAHALAMVRTLLDTLVNDTLGGKRLGSEHAQQFLQSQIQDYEHRLHDAEDKLAAFKSKHLGLMPTEQGG